MTFLMPCQPLPPGQLGMVFSILILHSNPGDFLFLDKFTSTGFINKIYSMEVRQDDIWVVTPPKCGTTWMQELVWLIANNLDFDRASNLNQVYRFPFLEMESVTYWDAEYRGVELGSLKQTVENQTKFFANSMKVYLNINRQFFT
jgi:hypothetical protein